MSRRITVIGSANVDFVIRLPRLPQKGESVSGGPFVQSFGGKGSNQAIAARRAGAEVAAVFNLGGDHYARELMDTYLREGIDATHVAMNPGQTCGVGMILVDAAGDNLVATDHGANDRLSVEQVDKAANLIADSSLVMVQMEAPDATIQRAIDIAAGKGTEVMLNFAPARQSTVRLDGKIGILAVNETEASSLTGLPVASAGEATKAARILSENGHRVIIVTLGANGCLVHENNVDTHYPAYRVSSVDATGAGDTFCGAFAAAHAEGRSLPDAVRFASAAGALCASRLGAMPSIPVRADIENLILTNKQSD